MSESTGWMNMSRGWRRAANRLVRRGLTQQEEMDLKVRREAWMKEHGLWRAEARWALPVHLKPQSWLEGTT